jgi:hypothetical protein
MSDREQLTYLRNNDLRAEIVRAVGGNSAPYETAETSYCLRKADLVRVAETLTSYDEPSELTLRELYDTLDAAVPGMDHSHNAGNTWGIARGNLKALHRAVNDDAPLVTDGGSDVCRDDAEHSGYQIACPVCNADSGDLIFDSPQAAREFPQKNVECASCGTEVIPAVVDRSVRARNSRQGDDS